MATIKDMFVMVFLAVAGFGLVFTFVTQIAVDNGATLEDNRLNETYIAMQGYSEEFNKTLVNMQNLANATTEADIGDFAFL